MTPLTELFNKLARAASGADPEEAIDRAGLDQWEAPPEPIHGVERSGVVDARSGAALRSTSYPGSYTRPDSYPEGWPFLPEREATHAQASDDAGDLQFLIWGEIPEDGSAVAEVRDQLRDTGWSELGFSTEVEEHDSWSRRHIGYWRRGGRSRLLSIVELQGMEVLFLVEGAPEQLWSEEEGRPRLTI